MRDTIRFGDIGTIVRVLVLDHDTPVDLKLCSQKYILFRKPDEATVEKTAEFFTDGSDGYMQYTTTSGDIDQTGIWTIQGHIKFPTQEWHTTTTTIVVAEVI